MSEDVPGRRHRDKPMRGFDFAVRCAPLVRGGRHASFVAAFATDDRRVARPWAGISIVRRRRSGRPQCANTGHSQTARRTSRNDRLCSLMSQRAQAQFLALTMLRVPVFSSCYIALYRLSWVHCDLAEISVGQCAAASESAPSSAPSLGRRSARELVSASCLVDRAAYAGSNSFSGCRHLRSIETARSRC